ncbi:hypothetical protein OS493_019882 [Desmophyllum pertusum]|uniref:Secreted protein n=1 Tax=Desmophyllum pertusum TaxID=174260 RepID=A0A9X0CKB4_9CNID|nr:hypothetical protein OS493_019882 [Desmophyllum pertusum]
MAAMNGMSVLFLMLVVLCKQDLASAQTACEGESPTVTMGQQHFHSQRCIFGSCVGCFKTHVSEFDQVCKDYAKANYVGMGYRAYSCCAYTPDHCSQRFDSPFKRFIDIARRRQQQHDE